MKDALYVYSDSKFLSLQGLSEHTWEAWLLVYRAESGITGFLSDSNGIDILTWLLGDSVSISRAGIVRKFLGAEDIAGFFASVMANNGLTIHSPDEAVVEEAQRLADYKKFVQLSATLSRYGKAKPLPSPPDMEALFEQSPRSEKALLWLLAHSARIGVWNRFTEYGLQPTFITAHGFMESIADRCAVQKTDFLIATAEKQLPCW